METLTPEKIEEVRASTETKWKVVALLGVGLLVAPFVMLAIGGIVGLAVAAAIGFTAVQFAPVFARRVADAKARAMDAARIDHIKKVEAAAAANPIPTMESLLIAKKQAWKVFEKAVTDAVTARSNFKLKVDKFKLKWPHRAKEFEDGLARMTAMVEKKKVALADAKQALNDGDLKLEEMKAYYEMSKDLIEANRAAGMDTGDAFEKLKADTACDVVFAQMHQAFAELEVADALDVNALDRDDGPDTVPPQLAHNEPAVLEVTPVRVTQKVSR